MMRILGYIISLAGILQCSGLEAQQIPKRERDWVPSALYLSLDPVSYLSHLSGDDYHYEMRAKVDFDNFFMVFDYGSVASNLGASDFDYHSDGSFFRIGPQVNFMPYSASRSSLCFGVQYGHAQFEDKIDYFVPGETWNDASLRFQNNQVAASWFETTLGLSAQIVGPLYMGYTVRFRLGMSRSETDELTPYEIPGFGPARKASNFGFSYYITYRFGFRNKPVPSRPVRPKRLENTGNDSRQPSNQ